MPCVSLRGIVFDFDGVIANSEPLHFEGYRQVLEEQGIRLRESDYYERYLGFDDAGAFAAIARDQGLSWSDNQVAALVERKASILEELESQRTVLFPGAADAIKRLAADGPLAIASGALRAEILRTLDRADLRRYFALIVAAEDTGESKPSPAPYLRAVERLAAVATGSSDPARYVAIEDSHWGLEAARAAGLKTVAVTHTYAAAELKADLTVANLDDLTWSRLSALTDDV
jgi:HAD superfamily hydrolase (TIGR01509 family)